MNERGRKALIEQSEVLIKALFILQARDASKETIREVQLLTWDIQNEVNRP